MSKDWMEDVLDFHRKFCPERIGTTPKIPEGRVTLLLDLIEEEVEELNAAFAIDDLPEIADAMADLIYVVLGAATTTGIDLRPVWDAVQAANMAKDGSTKRSDGKLVKPPGWTPPDIESILAAQQPIT